MSTQARPLSKLAKASFLGIEFRADAINIKGGLRKFTHEYPHRSGGRPEKLGRKLYTFNVEGVFLIDDKFFPTAWPGDIGALRSQFEQQTSGDLVIPTVGKIQAYCVDWDIQNSNRMMNGERMRMLFEEDQEVDQLVDQPLVLNYTSVDAQYGVFLKAVETTGFTGNLLQSIANLMSDIQGLKDQVDLQASILSTKLQQLSDFIRQADEDVQDLNKPPFWSVVRSLHDLAVSSDNLNRDLLAKLAPIGAFTVFREMTVSQVAQTIYGDTLRAVEIMKLNPIENPFSILPGTVLRYYQDALPVAA